MLEINAQKVLYQIGAANATGIYKNLRGTIKNILCAYGQKGQRRLLENTRPIFRAFQKRCEKKVLLHFTCKNKFI